jgi:glycine/D-amino acid oxidase-like deaminating enzyme/nitrite reductase/ring-hydroxylating ferredoxin subunit
MDIQPLDLALLESDQYTEVCIVGAGIAGLTAAYVLSSLGKAVTVLDDGSVGGGETGRTTAHLATALDDRYFELENLRGETVSRLAAESHTAAISKIESIIQREAIDCEFQRLDGFLFLPPNRSIRTLKKELAASRRAGLEGVEAVARAPISSFDTGPCLRFPRQGQFHPMKYLSGLVKAVRQHGGVLAGAHVVQVDGGTPARVKTKTGYTITADAVIIATNGPITDMASIHTRQFPYRTYAIAATIPPGSVQPALYWDTLKPYHYIRLYRDDTLIVGGEDHRIGQDEDPLKRFRRLERWARARFPIQSVTFRWSGQVIETMDGLAFIGKDPAGPENIYIVTGDSGMGMTHGTISGILLPDLIMGRQNSWAEVYDPGRKPLGVLSSFLKENADVAAQTTDWATGGDVKSIQEVRAGSGAIIRHGASNVAVYRSDDGLIHAMSAACTHQGCVVQWNNTEKSWDCPCHGSRFDRFGKVVNGPASRDLAALDARKVA